MCVWYVKFKGSLLVDTVQSWPLIGRHVKGDLAGSSDVTVLEISLKLGWAGFGKQLYTPLGTAFFALRDWQRIQSDGLGWKKYFKEIIKIHFQIILTLLQPVLSNKCPRACLIISAPTMPSTVRWYSTSFPLSSTVPVKSMRCLGLVILRCSWCRSVSWWWRASSWWSGGSWLHGDERSTELCTGAQRVTVSDTKVHS